MVARWSGSRSGGGIIQAGTADWAVTKSICWPVGQKNGAGTGGRRRPFFPTGQEMSCQPRRDETTLETVAQLLSPYVCEAGTDGSLKCEPRTETPVVDVNSRCGARTAQECGSVEMLGARLCEWKRT